MNRHGSVNQLAAEPGMGMAARATNRAGALYDLLDDIDRELGDHSWMSDSASPISLPVNFVIGYITPSGVRCSRCGATGEPIFRTEAWDRPIGCDGCGRLMQVALSEAGQHYVALVLDAYGTSARALTA